MQFNTKYKAFLVASCIFLEVSTPVHAGWFDGWLGKLVPSADTTEKLGQSLSKGISEGLSNGVDGAGSKAFKGIGDTLGNEGLGKVLAQTLQDGLKGTGDALGGELKRATAGLGTTVGGEAKKAINGLGTTVGGEAKKALNGLGVTVRNEAQDAVNGFGKTVKKEMQDVIKDIGTEVGTELESVIKPMDKFVSTHEEKFALFMRKVDATLRTYGKSIVVWGLAALIIGTASYLGIKYVYAKAVNALSTPPLEMSKSENFIQRFINKYIRGIKPSMLEDLILSKRPKEEAMAYRDMIINAEKNDSVRPNLLITGDPGTGKTEIAKRIARETGSTYILLSGSDFAKYSDGKAVQIMQETFEWAERKGNVIIFIDEVEVLLGDRDAAETTSKQKEILTKFLAHTGTRSKRYAVIAATNKPGSLDYAVGRRFDEMLEVPLPEQAERVEIFKQYFTTHVLKDQKLTIDDQDFSAEYIEQLAAKMVGLSGGEIEGIAIGIGMRAKVSKDLKVDRALVEMMTDKMIEKHKRLVEKKNKSQNPIALAARAA